MQLAPSLPTLAYLLLAAAAVVAVLAARRAAISDKLKSWSLFVPRLVVLGGLIVILLHPVHRSQEKLPPRSAEVLYLVDSSRSMSLDGPPSRHEQVKQFLFQAERQVAAEKRPKTNLFSFGESLVSAPGLGQLAPLEDRTLLVEALDQLPSRFDQEAPHAVVLASDGVAENAGQLAEAAGVYKELGVPIHVVSVGDRNVRGDVAIVELSVPRQAERGAKVPVRGVIRSHGFDGRRVVAEVRPARPGAPPLASLPLLLGPDPLPVEMVIDADADLGELVLETTLLEGESAAENNRVPFRIAGRDRKIRVLYMEGTQGNEYHWLRDALQEDPDIECVPMVVNHQYAERPRLQRIDDPYRGYPATREELFQFDVVICSDISQGAFTREQIEWTAELVGERGGGFAMVGGITSFGAGGWDQTTWEKLIPLNMSGRRDWLYYDFQVRIPSTTPVHPIWRLLEDDDQNRRALASMPPFHGTNLVTGLKPAATLLAESASPLPQVGVMPIMACETYGRGRTFALTSDTTVDWGRDFESRWGEGDNRYFRRFWRNVVRWLSEQSIGGGRRLHVETDKIIYRPGESIEIVARAFDEAMRPTVGYQVTARLTTSANPAAAAAGSPPPAGGQSHLLSADASLQRYAGKVPAEFPGQDRSVTRFLQPMTVEVVAAGPAGEIARTLLEVQLLFDSRELLNPQPAPQNLEAVAQASGGKVLSSPAELAAVLASAPRKEGETVVHQRPLWDRSYVWLSIVGLLVCEWALRRKAGFG